MSNGSVTLYDNHPSVDDMYQDIIIGFSQNPRVIPPKYFYDEKGSQLFDLITRTQDYYPTRTEVSIFKQYKQDIITSLPHDCVLIEPGGGSHSKVMHFINELRPSVYVPIDISRDYLRISTQELADKIPWLTIHAVCDDFAKQLMIPEEVEANSRVVFFPGSSIGNFHPSEVVTFLKNVASSVGEQGQLLIGVDLKKDKLVLQKAYDDAEGVTAQFNLNLLARINDQLAADFDLQCWKHCAYYNTDEGRIEMHLKSECDQIVNIQDHEYYFAQDETIHTENSYKYTIDEFIELAAEANFTSQQLWQDSNQLFSVHLFQVQSI